MPEKTATVFSPARSLPARLLVEASAGTGKTYALCGLAAYLIGSATPVGAAPVTIDDFVVVTFTNMATEDLKSRIRERLVSVRDALAVPARDDEPDEVVRALRDDAEAAVGRLNVALSEFGNLAVSTIHGFAQRMIALYGGDAGLEPDLVVLPDDSEMFAGAVADELAVQAEALEELPPFPDGASTPDLEGLDTVDEMSWIPPAGRVLDVAKLFSSVPDLDLRPGDDMVRTFVDLVDRHRHRYVECRSEVIAAIVAAKAESGKGTIFATTRKTLVEPLRVLTDELEVIRSGWVARRAVGRAARRRAALGVRNYDDLLVALRDALGGPGGDDLAARIAGRYRVALIDEFQDTDRVQWDIFERCFGTGDGSRLVVVGDPKQAIYRFRGADVHTYQRVAGLADVAKESLTTNHRSDEAVIGALDAFFDGVGFGPGVEFVRVAAAGRNAGSGIAWAGSAPDTALPAFRLVTEGLRSDDEPPPGVDRFDHDLVDWIRRLRAHGELRRSDGTTTTVSYADIAVLVQANHRAMACQELLTLHGIPSVVHTDDDVRRDPTRSVRNHSAGGFDDPPSEAAWNWRLLLEAIARPSDSRRTRAATTTVFAPTTVDWTTVIASDTDPAVVAAFEGFQMQLARWARVLTDRGVADLLARLRTETSWLRHAARRDDGGRLLTDIEHIGELFTAYAGSGPTTPDALITVLEPRGGTGGAGRDAFARRLASEAPAVTIMTIHKAKGLEFPVVFALDLADGKAGQKEVKGGRSGARFHDDATDTEVLDVGRDEESLEAERRETGDDDLRKLYVAMTRARNHLVTYWRQPGKVPGPLHRVLTREADATGVAPVVEVDPALLDAIAHAATMDRGDGTVVETFGWVDVADRVIDLDDDHGVGAMDRADAPADASRLGAATLHGRRLDRTARQWSFSAVTQVMEGGDGIGVPTGGGTDEGHDDAGEAPLGHDDGIDVVPSAATNTALGAFAGGRRFGTFTHEILERIDFAATPDEIRGVVERHADRGILGRPGRSEVADPVGAFVEGLHAALHAPIGPLGSGGAVLHLADIARADRLAECDFDLRLDTPEGPESTGRRIAGILVDLLAPDDPYRPWATGLAGGRFDLDLRGHLTGSIDLVARIRHPDGSTRFHVSDYKTNTNPAGDYGPASLTRMMTDADYPLQALLYQVALHRFLRWRLAGYDPAVHLGATTYLFVRGMSERTPDATADPPGVARWDIPTAVVTAVDGLFAGSGAVAP